MRGDNLKKHMKRNEREYEDNFITRGVYDWKTVDIVATKGQQIRCTSEKSMGLEKRLHAKLKEFNRKMEIGRKVKFILDKHGYNENGLDNHMKEALKTYELHGKLKRICTSLYFLGI